MEKFNQKRVEFSGSNVNDAFELQKILLRNGYNCFVWGCEDSIVVEYEFQRADYREGEYVYIDPNKQYIGEWEDNTNEG